MVAKKVVVVGKVQGVGFRAWTMQQAQNLGVAGWVRNLPDGNVEALIQGDEVQVGSLLKLLELGPALSRVDHISISEMVNEPELMTFEIRYYKAY